jgi:thiamine-phosphate pyrophosphorylase
MDGPERRARLSRSRLYLVLEARPHGKDPRGLLAAALRGGVDVVQLRDKVLADGELIGAAAPFREACREHGALFILNDRPDLVEACGSDGVHVGRADTPVEAARALVGSERLVGLSASTPAELEDVAGADYVGVTAFATPTKDDAVPGGLDLVRLAARTLAVPWFAIGGIDLGNLGEVLDAGAERVVVVRAITEADDPGAAAAAFARRLAAA